MYLWDLEAYDSLYKQHACLTASVYLQDNKTYAYLENTIANLKWQESAPAMCSIEP